MTPSKRWAFGFGAGRSFLWGVGIFLGVFGALWLLAEPLGLQPGLVLFGIMFVCAVLATSFWILASKLYSAAQQVHQGTEEIARLGAQLQQARSTASYCCVTKHKEAVCPLGVTALIPSMETTLRSSLTSAKHTFRWLGMSAFNVVHNSRDIFEDQKQVDFEFVTVNAANRLLLAEIDSYYMDRPGTLRSAELVGRGHTLLQEIARDVHRKLVVKNHNQMPSFRVILIDDMRALVSFYERGRDALKSPQIELVENGGPYCILKWFQMFYDKVQITERLVTPRAHP